VQVGVSVIVLRRENWSAIGIAVLHDFDVVLFGHAVDVN
jgi:hypothetical protein